MSTAPDPQTHSPSVQTEPDSAEHRTSTASTVRDLAERVTQLEQQLEEVLLLLSDVYRYGTLQSLLAAGEWRKADQETTKIMVEVAGKKHLDDIVPGDYVTFPSSVLQVIDQLWRHYSQDQFGFTIQLQLYEECGGSIQTIQESDMNVLIELAQRIGWMDDRKRMLDDDDDSHFSLSAPEGSLPHSFWQSPYGIKNANYFLARLMELKD